MAIFHCYVSSPEGNEWWFLKIRWWVRMDCILVFFFFLQESWRRRKFGILGIIIHDHDWSITHRHDHNSNFGVESGHMFWPKLRSNLIICRPWWMQWTDPSSGPVIKVHSAEGRVALGLLPLGAAGAGETSDTLRYKKWTSRPEREKALWTILPQTRRLVSCYVWSCSSWFISNIWPLMKNSWGIQRIWKLSYRLEGQMSQMSQMNQAQFATLVTLVLLSASSQESPAGGRL